MRTMENENLRVQISDHGAELSSIYDKAQTVRQSGSAIRPSGTATHRSCSRSSEK